MSNTRRQPPPGMPQPPVLTATSLKGSRPVGGFRVADKKPAPAKLTEPVGFLPKENRHDAGLPLPVITQRDLEQGLLSCINRGLIPLTADVGPTLDKQGLLPPLTCEPVEFRKHHEQFQKREIMTSDHGLATMVNVKLDLDTPVVPPKRKVQVPERKPSTPPAAVPMVPVDIERTFVDDIKDQAKNRENTRTYQQLLDVYSLHEFIIRRGRTLDATPEFLSYQRSFKHNWGAIVSVIKALERLLEDYAIPLAYVDGKKVAALAENDLNMPTQEQLLACLANREEVEPLLSQPGQRYKTGEKGFHAAAIKLQAVARMFLQRIAYLHLKEVNASAKIIQRAWHIHKYHLNTRTRIKAQREEAEAKWRQAMDRFIEDWPSIQQKPRLVVHIPSLSYPVPQTESMPYYNCLQNAQLLRLCELEDPNVSILYVSPFPVEPEAMQYFYKLLQAGGIANPEARVTLMYPENHARLPKVSLTKMVLFSPRLMQMLSSAIRGKVAYLVPGVMGPEELSLAAKLCLPMLGPEPTVVPLYCTKSGSKRIFEAADVVTPIGAYDMYDDQELFSILAKFIVTYPEYPRWLIKLDTEVAGRGIAYVDVHRLKEMQNIDYETADLEQLQQNVMQELREFAPKRVKIVCAWLYPSWASFLKDFRTYGGVIEAVPSDCVSSPSVNILIHPTGDVEVECALENLLSPQYCCIGAYYPHTVVPFAALHDAAKAIGAVCYQKKVIGHVSIDFVVYTKGEQLRLWAVGLDLHWTTPALAYKLFRLIATPAGGLYDTKSGTTASGGPPGTERCFVYSGLIYHPAISTIRHSSFFNMCKARGISFDVHERTGTLFHMVDTLLRGCFGVICVGKTETEAVAHFSVLVEFLQNQLYSAQGQTDDTVTNFHHVAAACRVLNQDKLSGSAGSGDTRRRKPLLKTR
eukprot:TRINITY_DN56143_c0_g1_i1.p1 TRINITY_DN56143_c0_g1~~TRINITY_DN56143_c0_g1_i1.p1  ORF type:complete len:918 (-),score=137.70 TRINITY_DN56143_c0_g1_i1:24-2777(-)